MGKNQIIITFVVGLVLAVLGFVVGMQYQKMQRPSFSGQFTGQNGQNFPGGGQRRAGAQGQNAGFRPVAGEIIQADDKSITVKLRDGSTKIVLISDSTSVTEATSAAKLALVVGKQVAVFGMANSDGSVTAQNVQVGVVMMGRTGATGR